MWRAGAEEASLAPPLGPLPTRYFLWEAAQEQEQVQEQEQDQGAIQWP